MKYTIRKSVIHVIGKIWMPQITCAQTLTLDTSDVNNARNENGTLTRESVSRWVDTHSGDFSSITDFSASIEDGPNTVEFDWSDPESEMVFDDCVYGDEE